MSREIRKMDHIRLALESKLNDHSDFNNLKFIHVSLPETSLTQCDLHTEIGGIKLESPIIINAMTGGAMSVKEINRKLAQVAKETSMAMAVGSQRAALNTPELWETFQVVREVNPNGIVIANLGADATLDEARQAVEMIQANMLQLHLNVPQELVMPEGDRDFVGTLNAIADIVKQVDVPVIVKETGFGMCRETYSQLLEVGVKVVDVGGRGGTNFIEIENRRRLTDDYSHLYEWGQSTVISLLESLQFQEKLTMISSGGIRNTLDIAKSFALGAKAVGVAGLFLRILETQGVKELIKYVSTWHDQLRTIITMLGVQDIKKLNQLPIVVMGEIVNWCNARGIDIRELANRGVG